MDDILLRLVAVVALAVVVALAGRLWRARDGRVHASDEHSPTGARAATLALAEVGIAAPLPSGTHAAVLLGSPTCAPCDTVKGLLTDLEGERDDFLWTSVDVDDHIDLVRDLRVMRVPTLLIVDDAGRIVARSSGVPRVQELRRVLDGTTEDERDLLSV
jgi:thiol-disulfide isomerase/thioredoxin